MTISGNTIDPLALAAIGFLGLVIAVTVALGFWVAAQTRKR